jgi:hypothetical protein
MGINTKGNTNKVKSAELKILLITEELCNKSLDKVFTRHFCNLHLHLDRTELALITWLPYMSNHLNVFEYSTKLMEQFKKASIRADELYKRGERYGITVHRSSNAFVSLIEKGLVIRLSDGKYIVSPFLVYHKTHEGKEIQERYLAAIREGNIVEMCETMIKKHRVR